MASRSTHEWHPDFIEYMKFIVNHPNYKSMPNKYASDGKKIRWISAKDRIRAKWWDDKAKEMGLKDRASVARAIHPKELLGLKPCQICGKKLSIFYVYPNSVTIQKLQEMYPEFQFSAFTETIQEIINRLYEATGKELFKSIRNVFPMPEFNNKDEVISFIIKNYSTRLSPGVMSNAPDRLDGFHTYNACCRSKQDLGRSRTNLARYTQDRRVYENWAEGNWNLSNRLMGEFNKFELELECPSCKNTRKMTADHIGPISLGFTHRPKFNPLCRECNSSKNNRMTLEDVKTLLRDEEQGEKVISWHSKYIWDLLKNKVETQNDALRLSKVMRTNLHHVLILFSKISEAGFDDFLRKYLHPEYSFVDYKFVNFHPLKGAGEILEKPLDSENKKKNAIRYIRISFESLEDYKNIENRNTKIWKSKKVDDLLQELFNNLSAKDNAKAELALNEVIRQLAIEAEPIFDSKI